MLFKGKCMCSHILLFKKDTSEITLARYVLPATSTLVHFYRQTISFTVLGSC